MDWCFFFKQKTAFVRLISDLSSDVCSSDLYGADPLQILDRLEMLVVQLAATPQGVTEESQARIVEVCKLWKVGPETVLRIFEENQVQISTKTIDWSGEAGAAASRSRDFHVDHSEFKKMRWTLRFTIPFPHSTSPTPTYN